MYTSSPLSRWRAGANDFMNQFSKRAARRLIQRALVLLKRDKHLRQRLREARATTLWVLEDWDFAWTVVLHGGRIEFERRPNKRPDVTFSWRTAEEFLNQAQDGAIPPTSFQIQGKQEQRRVCEPLLTGFLLSLRHVLASPVDDSGESLL